MQCKSILILRRFLRECKNNLVPTNSAALLVLLTLQTARPITLNNFPQIRLLNSCVILTRLVAFCRVLTLKIRLNNEHSSFLSVVMSWLFWPRVSSEASDDEPLRGWWRMPPEHCRALPTLRVQRKGIPVDGRRYSLPPLVLQRKTGTVYY